MTKKVRFVCWGCKADNLGRSVGNEFLLRDKPKFSQSRRSVYCPKCGKRQMVKNGFVIDGRECHNLTPEQCEEIELAGGV